MEGFGGDLFGGVNLTIRKKRTCVSRRPISDSQKFSQSCAFLIHPTLHLGSSCNDGQHNFQETTLCSDGLRSESRLKKLKLKLGGVTHTIHTAYASQSSPSYGVPQPQEKELLKGSAFGDERSLRGNFLTESALVKETFKHESVRKSRRVPKRRVLDSVIDEDDGADEEIRFLERLSSSKVSSRGRQKKYELYEDDEFVEDEEPLLDDESAYKNKKLGFIEGRSKIGDSLVEFPDGLPSLPRKQKAKLSEMEQQVKKAEAAQRRKIQSEKAAREAEAEAIKKILGQDSVRKKKEDKMKKLQDELNQGKSTNSNTLGSNTIRWVFGPTGTVVIFSDDIGLPNIFNALPCRYPAPREKCAGPNCTNVYKYRDSKSKLPLCSLHCYKAIHGKIQAIMTC